MFHVLGIEEWKITLRIPTMEKNWEESVQVEDWKRGYVNVKINFQVLLVLVY